jgi:hypothetical protein
VQAIFLTSRIQAIKAKQLSKNQDMKNVKESSGTDSGLPSSWQVTSCRKMADDVLDMLFFPRTQSVFAWMMRGSLPFRENLFSIFRASLFSRTGCLEKVIKACEVDASEISIDDFHHAQTSKEALADHALRGRF